MADSRRTPWGLNVLHQMSASHRVQTLFGDAFFHRIAAAVRVDVHRLRFVGKRRMQKYDALCL